MNGPNPRNSTICHKDIGHAVTGLLVQTYGYIVDELRKNGIDTKLPLGTIDGDTVRIIAIDTDHKFGIVGEIIDTTTEPATCWLARWNLAGTYCGTKEAAIKHSIARNAPYSEAPPPIEGVKYSDPRPPEPVHDMGLEDEQFAKEFETAASLEHSRAMDAANRAADELGATPMNPLNAMMVYDHAKRTLLKNNGKPPKKLSKANAALIVAFHRAYNGLAPVTRALAICALNSALGRFALYSRHNVIPPDEELVKAAEALADPGTTFYACADPETSFYWKMARVRGRNVDSALLPTDARVFMGEVDRLRDEATG